jgi:hypothetical protein
MAEDVAKAVIRCANLSYRRPQLLQLGAQNKRIAEPLRLPGITRFRKLPWMGGRVKSSNRMMVDGNVIGVAPKASSSGWAKQARMVFT